MSLWQGIIYTVYNNTYTDHQLYSIEYKYKFKEISFA